MKGERNNMILQQHYDQNVRSFLWYLKKTEKKLQEEPIHQLRVHIKKMRAILRLIEISSRGEFNKRPHFTLFSKFFNCAGSLREIQVNHLIIKKSRSHGAGPFKKHLKNREKQASKKLRNAVVKFDTKRFKKLNKRVRQVTSRIARQKIISQSEKFIGKEIRKIKRLMSNLSGPGDLHKIRIRLKSMSTILRLMEVQQPQGKWASLRKEIHPLELLIGEWHDHQVLKTDIRRFLNKTNENGHTIKNVKKFMQQVDDQNKSMAQQIEQELDVAFATR